MATDYSKLAFSSGFRYEHLATNASGASLKNHAAYTIGASFPSNQPTVTIPHNLGYTPFFRVFIKYPTETKIRVAINGSSGQSDDFNFEIQSLYADSTNLYIQVFGAVTGSGTIYYRIYEESQNA